MRDFLSELYRGEIRPCEGVGRYHGEVLRLERQCGKILEELNGEIGDKAREDLKKYISLKEEISFLSEEDSFARGVEFTARFFVSAID